MQGNRREKVPASRVIPLLPAELRAVAREPWIPWPWIEHRHRDLPVDELQALFDAYRLIFASLDVERLTVNLLPATEEDGCRRCGSCCAELVPDPVWPADIERWERDGNPLARFYTPEDPSNPHTRLTGYVHQGARLRLCPLLLWHPEYGDTFCVLHSLGPGQRPEACSGFVPNYPHCAISQRPVVW